MNESTATDQSVEVTAAAEPTAEAPKPSQEDMAAHDFPILLKLFSEKIEECSNRSLKRVVAALCEYPLERTEFRWSYPHERQAFNIGMKLFDCKFVIMNAALKLTLEERKDLVEELNKKNEEIPHVE